MKISTLLFFAAGVIGGIYLTSKEGDEARKKLKEVVDTFRPVVHDLLKKSEELLDKSKNLKSDDIRANIEKRISDMKEILGRIKPEDISDATTRAIQSVSKGLRNIRAELAIAPKESSARVKYEKMNITKLKKEASKKKVQIQPSDKKVDIINKLIQ